MKTKILTFDLSGVSNFPDERILRKRFSKNLDSKSSKKIKIIFSKNNQCLSIENVPHSKEIFVNTCIKQYITNGRATG